MACRELNIAGLLVKRGAMHWGDEPISALDHALQCAARARAARAADEVVLAALLHDVGHLISDSEETEFSHHGLWAARFLRPFVPARVAWLVEYHVLAKRYLCSVDRVYAESLSLGSTRSWIRQGGVLPRTRGERWSASPGSARPVEAMGRGGEAARRGRARAGQLPRAAGVVLRPPGLGDGRGGRS